MKRYITKKVQRVWESAGMLYQANCGWGGVGCVGGLVLVVTSTSTSGSTTQYVRRRGCCCSSRQTDKAHCWQLGVGLRRAHILWRLNRALMHYHLRTYSRAMPRRGHWIAKCSTRPHAVSPCTPPPPPPPPWSPPPPSSFAACHDHGFTLPIHVGTTLLGCAFPVHRRLPKMGRCLQPCLWLSTTTQAAARAAATRDPTPRRQQTQPPRASTRSILRRNYYRNWAEAAGRCATAAAAATVAVVGMTTVLQRRQRHTTLLANGAPHQPASAVVT